MYKINNGFTLIELAMVLLILGLLLTSILPPLAARIESGERNDTQVQLDEIEEAIHGFALRQNRLPCPDCRAAGEGTCIAADVDDGVEDRVGGECKTEVGNLPWFDLGVGKTDAWGQNFTYRVTESFADDTAGTACGMATLNVSFELCSNGDNIVWNLEDNTDADWEVVANTIPAIVISHGKNWADAPTVHEQENYEDGSAGNNNNIFVDKDFSADATAGFDDLIFWISPLVLGNRMLEAGILP